MFADKEAGKKAAQERRAQKRAERLNKAFGQAQEAYGPFWAWAQKQGAALDWMPASGAYGFEPMPALEPAGPPPRAQEAEISEGLRIFVASAREFWSGQLREHRRSMVDGDYDGLPAGYLMSAGTFAHENALSLLCRMAGPERAAQALAALATEETLLPLDRSLWLAAGHAARMGAAAGAKSFSGMAKALAASGTEWGAEPAAAEFRWEKERYGFLRQAGEPGSQQSRSRAEAVALALRAASESPDFDRSAAALFEAWMAGGDWLMSELFEFGFGCGQAAAGHAGWQGTPSLSFDALGAEFACGFMHALPHASAPGRAAFEALAAKFGQSGQSWEIGPAERERVLSFIRLNFWIGLDPERIEESCARLGDGADQLAAGLREFIGQNDCIRKRLAQALERRPGPEWEEPFKGFAGAGGAMDVYAASPGDLAKAFAGLLALREHRALEALAQGAGGRGPQASRI